jgi:hypothetical protein
VESGAPRAAERPHRPDAQPAKEVRSMYFAYPQRTEDRVPETVVKKTET